MKRKSGLVLKKEVLGELSGTELASVRGGTQTTEQITKALTTVLSGGAGCQSCCSCTAVSDTVER
jgi:hypothetical protein